MQQPLLTIGIPTYNRATYLDRCLNSIIVQLDDQDQEIELIIANNASTDHTTDIISKYLKKVKINYFENKVNGGPDSTSSMCFDKAMGKYVWVLGDDEFLIEGALKLIIGLLKNKNYGDVYLHCIPFHKDEEVDLTPIHNIKTSTYKDPIAFLKKLHYYVTFISGNIINKSLLTKDYNYAKHAGTNIVQVDWTIKAIFAAEENIFVETPLIAAKQNNSGGYRFVTTFAKNYNSILRDLVQQGYHKSIVDITNTNLINSYFPPNIIKLLYYENRFDTEKHFSVLLTTFWKYKSFWFVLFPIYSKYWIKNLAGKKMIKYKN